MEKKPKSGRYHRIIFLVCLCSTIVLLTAGFILPPLGVIDNSVLIAVGLILGFATLDRVHEAIKEGRSAKFTKGDISLTVGNTEEP